MKGKYSIKDLEALSGIKAHTIRIWEQRYSLLNPERTSSNIRYYSDSDVKHLLNISLLNSKGLKISHIAKLSIAEIQEKVREIQDRVVTEDEKIKSLSMAMMRLDTFRFEKILTTTILQMGFEETMINVVAPFLKRIGILWQTGSIVPAQEHFISNIIRQKIIVAIDGQADNPDPQAEKFLLFLPEEELHELTLLFSAYLIKSRRKNLVYLGAGVPLEDTFTIYENYKPDCILSVFTSSPTGDEVMKMAKQMKEKFKGTRIFLSGQQVLNNPGPLPKEISVLANFREFISYLDNK